MRNKEQLLNRIRQLTTVTIEQMSDDVLDMLTMGYDESLVRALFLQGQTNLTQRRIFKRVKIAFDNYYYSPFTTCPDYMLDYMKGIKLDLECGLVLTDTEVKNENETEGAVKEKENPITSQKDAHNSEKLKKENEELKAKVETLQTKLKDAQEALDVYKNAKNINWHDKVRLELAIRIMEKADINLETYGNKAKAARILQAITKLPISTCSNYASNRDLSEKQHGDEIEKINSNLRALNKEIQL